jgi:hypothetical protein
MLCALGTLFGQPATKEPAKNPPAFKLPSGAIIIVTGDAESLDIPQSIRLTPSKWKELQDQIETLKRLSGVEKPINPTSCKLAGKLEQRGSQWIAFLKATYEVKTNTPNSLVFLGGQKAQTIKAVTDDGKTPLLFASDKGLSVQFELAGEHRIHLDFELPLAPRLLKTGEIGFDLGLPGSAITLLTFEPLKQTKRISITTRTGGAPDILPKTEVVDADRLAPSKEMALGPITWLGLSWEDSARETNMSVQTDIVVNVSEAELAYDVRMLLRGSAKQWRIQAPATAEVSVARAPTFGTTKPSELPLDQAPKGLYRPSDSNLPIWRIEFAEPNVAELMVSIRGRIARPKGNDPKSSSTFPIGPFAVVDVAQQSGTILIKSPPYIRVQPIPEADTQRLDGPTDPNSDVMFQYRYKALPQGANKSWHAPLKLEVRGAIGSIQTHVKHSLQLLESGWKLKTEVNVVPIRTEVSYLDLEVPSLTVQAGKEKRVESVLDLRDLGQGRRVIRLALAATERTPFSLNFEIDYPFAAQSQEITISLPRVLGGNEGENQVSASVPEGFDLRAAAREWLGNKLGTWNYPLLAVPDHPDQLAVSLAAPAAQVVLSWHPHRPDIRVDSTADVTLSDRQGRASQQIRLNFAEKPPKKLRLRASAAVAGVTVTPGTIESITATEWSVAISGDSARELTLQWNYSFPIDSQTPAIPLVWMESVTSWESKVRIWRDPNTESTFLPSVMDDGWQDLPLEVLPDRKTLPLLVLRSSGASVPLRLQLSSVDPAAGKATTNIWIDRALVQGQQFDNMQRYRTRIALRKWLTRSLDLELPAGTSDLEGFLDGRPFEIREAVTETDRGRVIRVPLPAGQEGVAALIELRYRVPVARGDGTSPWSVRWYAPRPRGPAAIGVVRWAVALPPRSVALSLGGASFEERWSMRNGLPMPVAARNTSELDQWITAGIEPDERKEANWDFGEPGITARQGNWDPLRVVVVPHTALLLFASLLVLACGLGLARCPQRTVGVILALLAALGVGVGFTWPQLTGQILAAGIPGFVLLLTVLGVQRFVMWRYHRKLARLPGFRQDVGSSMVRSSSKRPVTREASTIDSPIEEPWATG